MRVSRPWARSMPSVSISSLRSGRLRLGVNQQHAVLVQPDLAGLGTEMNARAQIVVFCAASNAAELDHGRILLQSAIEGFARVLALIWIKQIRIGSGLLGRRGFTRIHQMIKLPGFSTEKSRKESVPDKRCRCLRRRSERNLRRFRAGASNCAVAHFCLVSAESGTSRTAFAALRKRPWHRPCEWVTPTAGRNARPGMVPEYPRIREGGTR